MDNEEAAIKRTLQYFFDGLDNLDAETIKKAFYPKADTFYIAKEGKLGHMAVSDWDKSMDTVKANPDHIFHKEKSKKHIAFIDITGTAASAKVEWVFSTFMFTDYYNLLKIDSTWYIVNKTYHTTIF